MVMMLSISRYPAVYVASYVERKSEVRKRRQRDLKMLGCFVVNLVHFIPLILMLETMMVCQILMAQQLY